MEVLPYFKYIAENLKVLGHRDGDVADNAFLRTSGLGEMEELLQKGNCKDLVLVLETGYDGNIIDEANNVLDDRLVVFYILARVNDAGDFTAKDTALALCYSTLKKVIGRMRLDAKLWHENKWEMRGLNLNSMYYYTVGPVGQGWHGVRVSFKDTDIAGIVEDADDWLDL